MCDSNEGSQLLTIADLFCCRGGYSNHTDSRFVREEGKLMSDICLSLLGKGQSALELCNALIILCASLVRIDPRTN